MAHENDKYVIRGLKPTRPLIRLPIGSFLYDCLVSTPNKHAALLDVFTGRSISYREVLVQSCQLAAALLKAGYEKNSIFSICSENNIEFFIPILSSLYIGAAVAPINPAFTPTELKHALSISKPRVVFCSKNTLPKLLALRSGFDFIKELIVIDSEDDIQGIKSRTNFVRTHLGSLNPIYGIGTISINIDEHPAFIMLSSGTTGLPKGVVITHANFMAVMSIFSDPVMVSRGTNTDNPGFGFLPFYHAYGFIGGLYNISVGRSILVMNRFDPEIFLGMIEKYKIETLSLVPPLAVFLAKNPITENYDLSSVKTILCGAAPLSKEVEDLLKEKLNIKDIRQSYGLTEATLGVVGLPDYSIKAGSVGVVVPHVLAKVRDPETGKSLGPNQVGELCFKGALIMKEYVNAPEATRNAITPDGWLLTGDLGYYDEDQYFYIAGRIKELIKYNGLQVPPAELEAILLRNPKIRDVGVVGLPDEKAGELPLAFVVKNDEKLTEKEVEDFLADKVSPYKKLRGGVIFVKEIPKNPSGKILRRALQDLLKTYGSKL